MKFLDEEPKFKNCIKNICVYCYDLAYDVVIPQKEVFDFINNFSSEEIKPYHIIKLITLKDYLDKYKDKHIKISKFYGDLTPKARK